MVLYPTEKVAPVVPLDVPKRCVPECDMVKRGEIEVVMTTTGAILFVPQSLDE